MMTDILTIDTSSDNCSVALMHSGKLTDRISESKRQSAQRVLPMISELLAQAGSSLAELDLIAVVAGPGSFTGVRIGVAVAQGLSMTQDKPVIALSSLALTAMATVKQSKNNYVLVCEEAREREVYFAAYRKSEKLGVELLGNEQVAVPELLQVLPENTLEQQWDMVGNGWTRQSDIQKRLGCRVSDKIISPIISSEIIVQLATLRFDAGEAVTAEQLRPNYVKEQLNYS